MDSEATVNGLPLPALLMSLIQQGRWVHPGEERLRELIPFFGEPVNFLHTVEAIQFESTGHLADDPEMSEVFHMIRGSKQSEPVELPWLDADRAVFIAVNRIPGDDIAIALDYRTDPSDPRVVANDWGIKHGCIWRQVVHAFSNFVQSLGLG
jgi:hypothetical protein